MSQLAVFINYYFMNIGSNDSGNDKEVLGKRRFFGKKENASTENKGSSDNTSNTPDSSKVDKEQTEHDKLLSIILGDEDSVEDDPDFIADYYDYCKIYDLPWKPFGNQAKLSFEEFKAQHYGKLIIKMIDHFDKFGFLPALPGSSISGPATSSISSIASTVGPRVEGLLRNVAYAAASGATETASRLAAQYFGSDGSSIISYVKGGGSDNSGSKGGGGRRSNSTPGGSGSLGGHNTSHLSLNPKPTEINFSTGIENNAYGQYFVDPSAESPVLHLTHARISLQQLDGTSRLYNFFSNVLVTIFQLAAQKNISFNVNAISTFSISNLTTYLDNVLQALQCYYFVTSLITYQDVSNRNQGMLVLRQMLTSDDLDYIYQIGRLLRQLPIPPNFKDLCFYLNQTYASSSVPNAALLKLVPMPFEPSVDANGKFTALYSNGGTLPWLKTTLGFLNSDTVRSVGGMLARVAENWIDPDILVPLGVPLHDSQFLTLWSNLANLSSDSTGATKKSPSALTSDTPVVYSAYADNLDGGIFGLFSIYDSTNSKFTPNLMDNSITSTYPTGRFTNRISYMYNSTAASNGFYPVVSSAIVPYQRGETYVLTTGAAVPMVNFGTERTLGVNLNSVTETGYKLFEWGMSLDNLKASTNKSMNKSGPRRSPRKGGWKKDKEEDNK